MLTGANLHIKREKNILIIKLIIIKRRMLKIGNNIAIKDLILLKIKFKKYHRSIFRNTRKFMQD